MRLGFNPGWTITKNHFLKSDSVISSEILKTLNFIEHRNTYPLTFPYYDPNGSIVTLWGRTLDPLENDKYKPYSKPTKIFLSI